MTWVAIIGALLSVFGPLLTDLLKKWLNRSLEDASKSLGVSAATYSSPEAARNALFDRAVKLTRNPFKKRLLRRMQLHAADARIGTTEPRPLSSAAQLDIAELLAPTADSRQQEVVDKVTALVQRLYHGDYRKAFDRYDMDRDGKIGAAELVQLLYDAEVGNRLTRWTWAKAVVDALDTDGDSLVSWDEFQAQLKG